MRAQALPGACWPCRPSRPANLARRLGHASVVDARAGERFRGEVELLDSVAGHVRLNRFFKGQPRPGERPLQAAGHCRRVRRAARGVRASGDVVHPVCGSGVTACHNLLAMGRPAGGMLYPGSWSEWSSDLARLVARGG